MWPGAHPLCSRSGALWRAPGAGNSRGLSGWRSSNRGAWRRLPPSRAGRGRWAPRGPGCPSGWGAAASASCSRAAAGGERGRRGRSSSAARRAASPPPPGGPRPLAVSASFPHTPPGPPGPQAFPALLLLSTLAATRLLLPLACLAASGPIPLPSPSQALLSHTHKRAPWLAGPPHFLQPSSPSQSFKRRRQGWAED